MVANPLYSCWPRKACKTKAQIAACEDQHVSTHQESVVESANPRPLESSLQCILLRKEKERSLSNACSNKQIVRQCNNQKFLAQDQKKKKQMHINGRQEKRSINKEITNEPTDF